MNLQIVLHVNGSCELFLFLLLYWFWRLRYKISSLESCPILACAVPLDWLWPLKECYRPAITCVLTPTTFSLVNMQCYLSISFTWLMFSCLAACILKQCWEELGCWQAYVIYLFKNGNHWLNVKTNAIDLFDCQLSSKHLDTDEKHSRAMQTD